MNGNDTERDDGFWIARQQRVAEGYAIVYHNFVLVVGNIGISCDAAF